MFTVHTSPVPSTESQPPQPPNVPLGAAVTMTGVPLVNVPMHGFAALVQLKPAGELVTVPVPVPRNVTDRVGPELVPVKQTTLAVMYPVTIAPVEEIPPELLFVVTVAEIRAPPQATPVAVSRPVELTVAMSGVFEAQVTWLVISLVTGGWM